MEIRTATTHDLEWLKVIQREIQQLHAAAHPEIFRSASDADLSSAMRKIIADPEQYAWVAAEKDALWGFAVAHITDTSENPYRQPARIGHVDQIAVLQSARRQGVGRALLAEIRHFMRQQGCASLVLDVLEFNVDALAFYRAEGFADLRRRLFSPL